MSVSVSVDPKAGALLRAIGLLNADGKVDPAWFQDPIAAVRKILANRTQRAALLELLDEVVGTEAGGPQGSDWHPLLDTERGNVYLTSTGDVIGIAAELATPTGETPRVAASLRLPLVDASGNLRAIAGTAEGPLELALDLELDAAAPVDAVRVRVTVDLTGDAELRFALEGVGPNAVEVSSDHLGRDVVRAIETLVRAALSGVPAGDLAADHLLAALGLEPGLPPLPIDRLVSDPAAGRAWLSQIAADPAALRTWFAHLAALLGAPAPDPADPLRARLASLGANAELVLRAEVASGELTLTLAVVAPGPGARLEAAVTALAIPLAQSAPVRVVTRAALRIRAPAGGGALIPGPGALEVDALSAGIAFDGTALTPELVATGVRLDGAEHASLDLTSANAVVAAATQGVRDAIAAALGNAGPALALLALLGFVPPRSDPGSGHLIDVTELASNPTRAIAAVHRAVLGDAAHDWSHMLRELALLLGLPGPVTGAGTAADPWRAEIAADAGARLDLAAWNARDASTPAGEQRLRLGLLVTGAAAPWTARLLGELLAFDLPAGGGGAARVIGAQRLEVALAPVPDADTGAGVTVKAGAVRAVAAWRPGAPFEISARAEGVQAVAGDVQAGPLTLAFPPGDPAAPDLGLGAAVPDVLALLRLLGRHALGAWGGSGALAVGDLLGLGGDGPQLAPPDPADLGSLLSRPGEALRAQLRALAVGLDANGRPHAERALASLAALLRDEAGAAGDASLAGIEGAGTYDSPWALPLAGAGDERAELIAWLEPAGPPPAWGAALAADVLGAEDARALLAGAPALAAFVPGLPGWIDPERHGDALAALSGWIAAGDGSAPLASQLTADAGWESGRVLASPHHALPRDPDAIAQVAAQLTAWEDPGGGRAVVLVGPGWGDPAVWDDLLAGVEPGRPAGAHFDLRGGAAPASVTAVATHYVADLYDHGGGDHVALAAQLETVVDRVIALTGRQRVILVAHSTAGVAARLLARDRPAAVRGVVTLGTAHAGGAPLPLEDPAVGDAVRLALALGGPALATTPAGAALERLGAALEGGASTPLPTAFAPPPGDLAGPVPGLAIGAALGGDLVATLADHLAARVTAAAAAAPPAPTHLGFGARVGLAFPDEGGALPALGGAVRIDAGRVRLASGPEPQRPERAVSLRVEATRPGGWLAGDPGEPGPRIRSAELAVTVVPAPGGSVTAEPRLVLRDVTLDGARRDLALGDPDLGAALDVLAREVDPAALADELGAPPLRGVDLAGLAALAGAPTATLRARRDALLDALEDALGGPLAVGLAGVPLELTLDRATWTLRLRSTAELALGDGVGVAIDGRLSLATLAPTLDATLRVGAVRLAHSAAAGTLTLSAPGWLDPVVVRPAPSSADLRTALAPAVSRAAPSAALSAALGGVAQGAVGPLHAFLADPGGRLAGLDGPAVQALLQSAAQALGLGSNQGLELPGGFVLAASGADPLRLELSGDLALGGAGDQLAVALRIDVAGDRSVAPGGTLTLDVGLPGDWGRVEVLFSPAATGALLVVTPQGGGPIQLLPTFSGFGSLVAAGTARLLPRLLQAIVDELRPAAGPPGGVLGVALALATALDVYADDAQGFEEPQRAARLAAMLEPGWLEQQAADGAALAALVAGLFGAPPLLPKPAGGDVVANGDRVTWTAPLPGGGDVAVSARIGAPPAATIAVQGFDAGPVVVESAELGFDGSLALAVGLRLDLGGDLAFLDPVVELGAANGRLALALLPLGAARRAEIELELAPAPALTFTSSGALGLVLDWGLPLVSLLALGETGAVLDDLLWPNGPTAREVLVGAGLITAGQAPQLATPLPALDQLALGAVRELARGITVPVTPNLDLIVVDDGAGRKGLRLDGHERIEGSDVNVDLRFGHADWLDDGDAGVTLWVLKAAQGAPPELDLGIDAIGLGAVVEGASGEPLVDGPVSIGSAGGLVFFKLDLLAGGQPVLTVADVGAAVEVGDAQIAVSSGDGDAFVQKLLPPQLQGPFSLAVEARAGQALQLHGGIGGPPGQLELTFPLDLDIAGVLQLDEVYIAARRSGNETSVLAAISGGASLGPVAMAVQRVGARARIAPGGTQIGFKPPDGLGLSIDTPALRLGGFVLIDEARGRYVGAFELAIVEEFSLVGVAIITTKRPDGTPGFALLLLIAIEFPVPIPLGFGFFFVGAGGLLGLNRGVDLDRLRLGLRSGTADSILFPTDVVRRIETIVRDLDESFPIAEGRFLVAPMVKLAWSTPPLVTAKVGVIIEIGAPLRLALLGVLRLALPSPDLAVVDLKVAFMGAIDIPASLLSFDASIYDSYVGYEDFKLSLEGDMALRIAWGPQPDFVMSVGGFHPSFRPGAHLRLPPMRRMSISLLKDNPRITLSAYFAVTTNTVQFGARLDLYVGVSGFSLEGYLGFDVLVQIVPFHLEARATARLAVKAAGEEVLTIALDLKLEGPTPWIARGKASFTILVVTVDVAVEVRMGEEAPAELPEIAVLPRLLEALADDAAWSSELGDAASELVHLVPPEAGALVVDAAGLLTVRQRVVPLDTDFSRFGVARPSDVSRLSIDELRVGAQAGERTAVTEAFAPGAYRTLSDKEALSAPAFEQRPAGAQSKSGDELATDAVLSHPVAYETLVFDTAARDEPERGSGEPAAFDDLVVGGRIGESVLSLARARADVVARAPVGPAAERYAVAAIGDLSPLDAFGTVATPADEGVLLSRIDAEARRDALIAAGVAADLQILPEGQLAA